MCTLQKEPENLKPIKCTLIKAQFSNSLCKITSKFPVRSIDNRVPDRTSRLRRIQVGIFSKLFGLYQFQPDLAAPFLLQPLSPFPSTIRTRIIAFPPWSDRRICENTVIGSRTLLLCCREESWILRLQTFADDSGFIQDDCSRFYHDQRFATSVQFIVSIFHFLSIANIFEKMESINW